MRGKALRNRGHPGQQAVIAADSLSLVRTEKRAVPVVPQSHVEQHLVSRGDGQQLELGVGEVKGRSVSSPYA